MASWEGFRIPIAIATIDPERKGHQNILFRQMLKAFEPPALVREVIVVADAGYPANATLKLITDLQWTYVSSLGIVSKLIQKLVGRLTLFQGISQVLSHRKTT